MSRLIIWEDVIKVTPNKILGEVSREVDISILSRKDMTPEDIKYTGVIESTAQRVSQLFDKYPKMQGLSAVQLGVLWRVAFLRIKDKEFIVINPAIIKEYGKQKSVESCASTDTKDFKHIYYKVPRPLFGKVEWYDINGKRHEKWYGKKLIRLWCHEIDHMNGKLIKDTGKYWVTLPIKTRRVTE